MQAGREEGRQANGNGERGRWTGKYVLVSLCGIDGSFQLRTLLDKPIDDTLSKLTSGLGLCTFLIKQSVNCNAVQICCSAHSGPACIIMLKGKNKHSLPLVLNIDEPLCT